MQQKVSTQLGGSQNIAHVIIQINGERRSIGRSPDCDSGRCGFESRRSPHILFYARVVKLEKASRLDREDFVSSSLTVGTIFMSE